MAQNRDRNWQDREESRGGWQGGEDFGQGEHEHGQHQESQGRFARDQRREPFGAGQQQPGARGGYGQQQGGEWNRMGRYGEEGWQGGGQGRYGQGGNYRMDRDEGQFASSRGSWGGSGGSDSTNRPYGEDAGRWGSGSGYGTSSYGSDGMSSRGGYGTGSYGSGGYGAGSYGSGGYGAGSYASRGYGSSAGRQGGEQDRGFLDRAADEVSSWFGDEAAQRRREMDEHRGRGPKGYTRSDERIREDVNDRLTDDGWLDASDIEVQVSSSEVTLTGQVNSREEKRRAEDIVEAISGVKHVQNNLRVKDRSSASTPERATTQFGSGTSASGTGSAASGSKSSTS